MVVAISILAPKVVLAQMLCQTTKVAKTRALGFFPRCFSDGLLSWGLGLYFAVGGPDT